MLLANKSDNLGMPGRSGSSVRSADVFEFAKYLARKHALAGELLSAPPSTEAAVNEKKLRSLWEITGFSANDFADETARFYQLPRLGLAQLLAAISLAGQFSHRFLRESLVFP